MAEHLRCDNCGNGLGNSATLTRATCGHSFCDQCQGSLTAHNSHFAFTCPACSKQVDTRACLTFQVVNDPIPPSQLLEVRAALHTICLANGMGFLTDAAQDIHAWLHGALVARAERERGLRAEAEARGEQGQARRRIA